VRAMSVGPRTTRTRAGIDLQQSGHNPSFSVKFSDLASITVQAPTNDICSADG
jgi:hypothetical protein